METAGKSDKVGVVECRPWTVRIPMGVSPSQKIVVVMSPLAEPRQRNI